MPRDYEFEVLREIVEDIETQVTLAEDVYGPIVDEEDWLELAQLIDAMEGEE